MTTTLQRHSSRQAGDSKRSTPARRQPGSAFRIAAIAVLIVLSGPQPQPVSASGALAPTATYVVDRTDDTNIAAAQVCSAAVSDCSLRGAISKANASAGADTITFAPATNGTPFTLTLLGNDALNATGDLDINDSLTISGNGAANTIIQGASDALFTGSIHDKVIGINQDGLHDSLTVSISGVWIRYGHNEILTGDPSFAYTGGGVDVFLTGSGNSISFTDTSITNNETVDSYGGGVNVDSCFNFPSLCVTTGFAGTVTLTRVTISNNKARQWGGGLNLFSDNHNVVIDNSVIQNNTTTGLGPSDAQGGGLNIRHTNGGSVAIHGTSIANNTSTGPGGGVAIAASNLATVSIDNVGGASSITGNTSQANGSIPSQGGGLFKDDTTTTSLTNVTISGNHADQVAGANNPHGGAIYQTGGGVLTVTGGTLDGSGGTGELFALNSTASATVRGATIQNATIVFNNLGSATLRAYANNIQTYTAAYSGGGTPAIGHNYWGTNNPAAIAPSGIPGSEWPKRLGAPVSNWADGTAPAGASLGGASLTGGTAGTLVVVSHGRGAMSNVPFGNGSLPYATQTCSDYYDFFTLSGSGTFTALVPVDNIPNCNTNTLGPRKVFWVTTLAECSSSTPNTLCWDLIAAGTSVNGQAIQITGLTNANLGGTPFVAGDPTGLDPTAVTLMNLTAAESTGVSARWVVLLTVVMLIGLGTLIWASWRRARSITRE